MPDISKELEDRLQHYGVKGMKWKNRSSDSNPEGGGSDEESEQLEEDMQKLGEDIDKLKGKVGDGPLDMLKYILFGETKKKTNKKPKKKSKSIKDKASSSVDDLNKSLKDLKSKVGNGPIDMIKYIVTGKRKVQHSGLNRGLKLSQIDNKYKDIGRNMVESARKRS